MLGFKQINNNSILSGIISKEIFSAISKGQKTILDSKGRPEKIGEIKFFDKDGPHIKYEGRKKFVEVGFFPSKNQNPDKVKPSEIFLSKIDLNGIKNDSFYSNIIEIFHTEDIESFKEYRSKQFIKVKIKSIEKNKN